MDLLFHICIQCKNYQLLQVKWSVPALALTWLAHKQIAFYNNTYLKPVKSTSDLEDLLMPSASLTVGQKHTVMSAFLNRNTFSASLLFNLARYQMLWQHFIWIVQDLTQQTHECKYSLHIIISTVLVRFKYMYCLLEEI